MASVGIKMQEMVGRLSQVSAITGVVYKYLNVVNENFTDSDVTAVELQFGVERSWIEANNIDETTITLKRYSVGGWTPLPTEKIGGDAGQVFYSANSPGLSVFAVSGQVFAPSQEEPTVTLVVGSLLVAACILTVVLVARRKQKI